jgi:hypothetical protein
LETLAADTNAILMEAREAGMSTSFIRHNQGTAQILALLSMNPDVPVEKVVLLAPVTTMDLQRIKLSNGEFTELANAMFAVLETGRTDFLDLSLGDSLSREMYARLGVAHRNLSKSKNRSFSCQTLFLAAYVSISRIFDSWIHLRSLISDDVATYCEASRRDRIANSPKLV